MRNTLLGVASALVVIGVVANATAPPKKPAASAVTPSPIATRPALVGAFPAPAAVSTRAASPSAPAPVASVPAPSDGLTGFGATEAAWNTSHTPDTTFAPGSVYDEDPKLPQLNGNTGARYTTVDATGGRITSYQVNFHTGTTTSEALAEIRAEFPPDVRLVASALASSGGCYNAVFSSATLSRVLGAALPAGVVVELQSADLSSYDSRAVVDALVQPVSGSESDALSGC